MSVDEKKTAPHILVVDDEEAILTMVSLCINQSGYTVSTATNVHDAFLLVAENNFSVIITDVMMPGENGISFLSAMQQKQPEIPVIIMTGCAQLDVAVDAIKNGAFDFIQKPFDIAYFCKVLNKAVDLVRLKQMEIDYRNELEEMVTRRTQELKEATIELYDTRSRLLKEVNSKSEFLFTVTHEMRTPMNGVVGGLDLLLDTDLSANQREYAQLARQAADNMLNLVDQVIFYSGGVGGNYCNCKDSFDVAAVITAVIDRHRPDFAAKHLSLGYEYPLPSPLNICGDQVQLVRLLDIVLGNAFKFTEQGGVLVAACMESEDERSRQLHLTITDTGIGIPENMLAKIFEPFVQVDPVLTRRYGGTGLGLSIASQIVGLFQGRIWAETAHGGGSCFHILLCTDLPVKGEL